MRRVISMLLAVCLMAGVSIPAHAVDTITEEGLPEAETSTMGVVTTLDELQEAVAMAESGDTIALGQTIYVNGETMMTDKDITLIRADGFATGYMIKIYGGTIDGFNFRETSQSGIISASPTRNEIAIQNCFFDGGGVGIGVMVSGALPDENLTKIIQCEFANCFNHSVNARGSNSNIEMVDCFVHDNSALDASGAVQSSGSINLRRCTITANTSWANAGVSCSGNLIISDCKIEKNVAQSTEGNVAVDVFCMGTWSITDNGHEGAGYYDVATGTKVALPVMESSDIAKLIFLTDEEAKDYFAPPASPDEDTTLPEDGGDDTENPIPAPGGDTDESEDNQPPESSAPPTGGDEDTSGSDQSGTERPETSVEDDSDNENDYIPPIHHKPTQRPSEPDMDTSKPEDEAPTPALVCGDTVIDASRSVVLAGYGDGQLHEEDPLTRAQLATIIYRLLTDESISSYREGQAVFDDVSADAWYYQAVNTIGHAGIVSGVGDGMYNPEGLVTWGQAITVISRFVESQECPLQHIAYDGWATPYIATAVSLGWIEDNEDFRPDEIISRGELVSLYNRVLELYR